MIPVDFAYCRPETESEAVAAFFEYRSRGLLALYYGGGSEIITMATAGSIRPDAVIDLKGIPGLCAIDRDGARIRIGGMAALDAIHASGVFPLLGETAARIADHTNQCRITLAGNLCGTVRYREAALPLLLADADVVIRGADGERTVPMNRMRTGSEPRRREIQAVPQGSGANPEEGGSDPETGHAGFCPRAVLREGEFIARVEFPTEAARLPYAHIKKTFAEKIGYPAVTLACLFEGTRIRAAFSGICPDPFRSAEIDAVLSEAHRAPAWRAERAAERLPAPPVGDAEGSAEYRLFLFRDQLKRILERGGTRGSEGGRP